MTFAWARGRLYDRLACFVLYELVLSAGEATVQECIERPRYRYPPKPLDTVTMQQRISRAHRLVRARARAWGRAWLWPRESSPSLPLPRSRRRHCLQGSERTMKIAEDLYNKGIISYPRTETQIFKSDFPFDKILGELASSNTAWGAPSRRSRGVRAGADTTRRPRLPALPRRRAGTYAARLRDEPGFFNTPAAGGKDDEAHPPIHPTKAVDPSSLQEAERNVYTYVVRHFLAACSRCAVGAQTSAGPCPLSPVPSTLPHDSTAPAQLWWPTWVGSASPPRAWWSWSGTTLRSTPTIGGRRTRSPSTSRAPSLPRFP